MQQCSCFRGTSTAGRNCAPALRQMLAADAQLLPCLALGGVTPLSTTLGNPAQRLVTPPQPPPFLTHSHPHTHRDVHVLMPDLRNHGRTTWVRGIHPPHTLEAAAADVRQFMTKHVRGGMPHLLIGLSLGGKVALELLAQLSEPDGPRDVLVGLKPCQQQEEAQEGEEADDGAEGAEDVEGAVGPTPADEEVRRLPQQVSVGDGHASRQHYNSVNLRWH